MQTTETVAQKIEEVAVAQSTRLKRSNLRKYINIVRELAIADFRLKYHDSVLGYFWSMLNPMLMFAVYYFVFTQIFISTIPDFPLFLLAGIISYAFFQDATFSAMNSLSAKSGIIKKFYFPRMVVIFSSTVTCSISYLINLVIFFLLVLFVKGFTSLVILTPIAILCLILFTTGVAFILATLFAHFRDMGQVWNVITIALFWLSPVVYNVEKLPEPISTIVYFNPLTRIFVLIRHYILYDYFDLRFLLMTILYSTLAFIVGYLVFRKYQNKLAELF